MKDFSFIHAADIHLDSPLKGLKILDKNYHSLLQTASRSSLDRLVREAVERQVAFVLISGDLLDGAWRDIRTGVYLAARLRDLADAGIRTFIVSGNHDAASLIRSRLELHPDVFLFPEEHSDTVILEEYGVALHGRSYPQHHVSHEFVRSYPQARQGYFNVGLLHTALESESVYAPCTLEELALKGYDYWALGHVHTFEVVSRDPWIVYPGIIQGRSIRETGQKGVVSVDVVAGEVIHLTHHSLDTVRWSTVTLSIPQSSSVTDILSMIKGELQSLSERSEERALIVRLTLEGAVSYSLELEKGIRELPFTCGGRITIEKICFHSSHDTVLKEDLVHCEGPLHILAGYQKRESTVLQESAEELLQELGPLFRKLPFQYFASEGEGTKNTHSDMENTLQRATKRLMAALQGEEL